MSTADHAYDDEGALQHALDEQDAFDHALRAWREDEGTDEQAHALEQRLLAALGAEALDATVTPVTTVKPSLTRVWLMLGLGALIGAGMLLIRAHEAPRANHDTAEHARNTARVEPALRPPAPSPSMAPVIASNVVDAQPIVEATPRPRKHAMRRSSRVALGSREGVQAEATRPREDELSLLQRSHKALLRNPALALALTEQHARDYPRGVFVQEREVLALEALLKQRRRAEAIERAQGFIAQQPSSPYAVRIRELLVRKPRDADTRSTSEIEETAGP